jgi:hypothetical protein
MTESTIVGTSVRHLLIGDVLAGTGETVVNAYADSKTRKGYRDVILKSKKNTLRRAQWNASTKVGVVKVLTNA